VSKKGRDDPRGQDRSTLRHVLVVGGTLDEWDDLGESRWTERRMELAKIVAHAGATWLTLRPYGGGSARNTSAVPRLIDLHEGCTVIVDPTPDGRHRFLAAIEELRDSPAGGIDESVIGRVLMAPAPCEPDLAVIVGPSTRLPPSLVWELSYCELVFIDTAWHDLAAVHLEQAISEFAHRHRRFGGIE
jgi:undecaprenyl diphosphate synthase